MAHATISGRLGKDPELKQSQAGKEYVRMSVAWQERQRDRNNEYHDGPTVWVSVTAFGRQAGNLAASLHKGDHVTVTGRMQPETWSSDRGEETVLTMTADFVAPTLFFQQVQVSKYQPQQGNQGGGWAGTPQQSQGGFSNQQQNDPWNSAPPAGGFTGQGDEDQPPF